MSRLIDRRNIRVICQGHEGSVPVSFLPSLPVVLIQKKKNRPRCQYAVCFSGTVLAEESPMKSAIDVLVMPDAEWLMHWDLLYRLPDLVCTYILTPTLVAS